LPAGNLVELRRVRRALEKIEEGGKRERRAARKLRETRALHLCVIHGGVTEHGSSSASVVQLKSFYDQLTMIILSLLVRPAPACVYVCILLCMCVYFFVFVFEVLL